MHNTTSNRLHKKNAPIIGRTGNERALFPTVNCTSQNINSKNILSRTEIEEVMAYVNGEMLNETPIQSSTASIGDTPNVEVEDHEISIRMFPLFFFP